MSKYRITLDGKTYEMEIELMDGSVPAAAPKAAAPAVAVPAPAAPAAAAPAAPAVSAGSAVVSPMPGTILRVNVSLGDTVKKDQPVLVLEAMKMENEIVAPKDGAVTALHVSQGDAVQGGAPLFEIGG